MTERIESVILENLIGNPEFCKKSLLHLHPEYYADHVDQILIKEIKRFYAEHNSAPTKKILKIFIEDSSELKQDEYAKALDAVESIGEPEQNVAWLVTRTEQFCQEKSIYNAIMESIQIMDGKNTVHDKGAIPGLLSKALNVSFDKSVGHNYFQDADDRYEFYHLKEDRIPFDLSMFNKITKGGLPKKTLSCLLAGTGVGKSLFMCHHAASMVRSGKNALYITLEMAEERISERIDCNLMDTPIDKLVRMNKKDFTSKIDDLKSRSHGQLVVKEYPTAGAHVGHFKALLDELIQKQNFKPDIIYIDYINICLSQRYKNAGNFNSYTIIKAIAEEMRGLAVEYDVPILTATQTTRSGSTDTDVDMTDSSESFGLPMTLDFFFAIIRTEQLDAIGQLMVKQLKNRFNDINYYKRFVIGINLPMFKLYDVENDAQNDIADKGKTDSPLPNFKTSDIAAVLGGAAASELDFD